MMPESYPDSTTPVMIYKPRNQAYPTNPPNYKESKDTAYNFALVCAFLRMGSSLVAFITSPLIFSLPDMNNR